MFGLNKTPAAPPDPISGAQATIDKVASALAKAEGESTDARIDYDRAMQAFVTSVGGKDEPSQQPMHTAASKVDSLRRVLVDARTHLELLTRESDNVKRLEAIRRSGGEVARLTAAAEEKLAEFEAASATLRCAETELVRILFSERSGLRQQFPDPQAQKDADWTRGRLRQRVMVVGEKTHCLVDSSFDADTGTNLAKLDPTKFYARVASARA